MDLAAVGLGGAEVFGDIFEAGFEAVAGLEDDFARVVEDRLGGAVVLVEDDDYRFAVFFVEGEDVVEVGPLEFVDGLVVIADGEDVGATFVDAAVEDLVEEAELHGGGVLEFVDEEVLVFFLEVEAEGGIFLEGLKGLEEHVGVVEKATLLELFLIFGVDFLEGEEFGDALLVGEDGATLVVFFSVVVFPSGEWFSVRFTAGVGFLDG